MEFKFSMPTEIYFGKDAVLNRLVDVKIDINAQEIKEYANSFVMNKDKLKNHPEEVGLEDIVRIYSKSLLKN